MRIQGLQKLTLLDYPGKTACTIFLGGCNFRCPFCHNAALVTGVEDHENFSEEELFDFLKRRQGILDGVCISGGEPLICPDLDELLKKIRDMGYLIKLDTNGSFPERLIRLVEEGLIDQVAMDLKNSREKYARTVGLGQFDVRPIEESVEYLLEGRDCRPRPGTLIIIAPDCFHGLKVLDGQVYHRIRLHFTMEVLDEREAAGGVLTSSLGWSGISGRWSSAGNTGKSCKILQFAQASPHF